ncbi:hypothetical protein WBG78_28900 [Chryseolinea sp. T2]|uniref:hypothetical protein n=1 Tax=Chryseolinea sp. T2 TaxID=3129255 RepID=UPI00307850A4
MKAIIKTFACAVCLCVISVSTTNAQWQGTTPVYYLSGNVGVGTSSPLSKLEVRSGTLRLSDLDIRYLELTQDGNGQAYGRGFSNSYAGARQFKLTGFSHTPNNQGSAQKDLIHFDGYNMLLLKDNGGSVGIGTSQPNALLDVYTGTPAVGSFNSQRWSTVNSAYYLTLRTVYTTTYGLNYSFIQTYNGTDYKALSIFQGNVGIGTEQPDALLTVKGKIHAKEVLIDVMPNVPDYVFEPDYKLMNLSELATYLKQNKHLPEVPSATEMVKTGMDVEQMNMTLLKKVEELTLYILQQEQKIKSIEERLKETNR